MQETEAGQKISLSFSSLLSKMLKSIQLFLALLHPSGAVLDGSESWDPLLMWVTEDFSPVTHSWVCRGNQRFFQKGEVPWALAGE